MTSHPDVIVLDRESEARELSVSAIRSLLERASLSSALGGYRVFVIPEADRLNAEAANALLKVVEDPPRGLVWALGASRSERLPATLRSRLVMITIPTRSETASFQHTPDALCDPAILLRQMRSDSVGRNMQSLEQLAKAIESQEDPSASWRETLASMMRSIGALWLDDPVGYGRIALGITRAWSLTDGTLSPRLALEWSLVSPYHGTKNEELPSFFHPSYL